MKYKETQWYKEINEYDEIIVFGAGKFSEYVIGEIENAGKSVSMIIVTKIEENPSEINGIPVVSIDCVNEDKKRTACVVIATSYEQQFDIKEQLVKCGFRNVIMNYFASISSRQINMVDECMRKMGVTKKCNGKSAHNEKCNNICIYVVTSHLNTRKTLESEFCNSYMKYIQAGASLTDLKICKITDNEGDNISYKNKQLCEMTAMYWVFKNDKENDYIGICHYSRYLEITDKDLKDKILMGIDVLLPEPNIFYGNIGYAEPEFFKVMIEAVNNVANDYNEMVEEYLTDNIFFCGNMMIAKRDVYMHYCRFVFKVIDEIERLYKTMNRELRPRDLGYYGEHLTNIYFRKHWSDYRIEMIPVKKTF